MKWFKTTQKLNATSHESPWTAAANVTRVLSSTVSATTSTNAAAAAAAALDDEFIFHEVFINDTFIQASLYQVQSLLSFRFYRTS